MATASPPKPKRTRTGYLATPLTREEQRSFGALYRQHGGLVALMGRKMCRKYRFLRKEDIYSSIDIAFIKTCRAWNPAKGTFSTLLTVFSEGEIRHFIRDHNWEIKAPAAVRTLGQQARYMLRDGKTRAEVIAALNTTEEKLKLALTATESIDHETKDFNLHLCPRPTPMELLEESDS